MSIFSILFACLITTAVYPEGAGTASGGGEIATSNSFEVTAQPTGEYPFQHWMSDTGRISYDLTASALALDIDAECWTAYFFKPEPVGPEPEPETGGTHEVEVEVRSDCTGMGAVYGGGTYNHGDYATIRADTWFAPTNKFLFWEREDPESIAAAQVVFANPYRFKVEASQKWRAVFGTQFYRVEIMAIHGDTRFHVINGSQPLCLAWVKNYYGPRVKKTFQRLDGESQTFTVNSYVSYHKKDEYYEILSEHENDDDWWCWEEKYHPFYQIVKAVEVFTGEVWRPKSEYYYGRKVSEKWQDDFRRYDTVKRNVKWVVYYNDFTDDVIIRNSAGFIWRNRFDYIEHMTR